MCPVIVNQQHKLTTVQILYIMSLYQNERSFDVTGSVYAPITAYIRDTISIISLNNYEEIASQCKINFNNRPFLNVENVQDYLHGMRVN